jgi:hypothetical protein
MYIICIKTVCSVILIDAFSNVLQGRVSVADIIGFNGLEMISSKPDGRCMALQNSFSI